MQYFDPNHYLKTIAIIGLGGTGANVARIVGRIAYDMQRKRRHAPDILLIDPDKVEEKNVGRQLFAPCDVGQYKVEVVGKRLNYALGLSTRWIPDAVDAQQHFDRYGSNLVISCVDNHLARREIQKISGVAITAGNHSNAGQVVISNSDDTNLIKRYLDDKKVRYLPKEGLLFPALLEPETQPEPQPKNLSCAELVATGEQDLLIND
ncbi:MAG: ThiF family adenylyltransferase, partial [Phototrophicaceae bacterium]